MLYNLGKGDTIYVLPIDRPASVYGVTDSRTTAKGNRVDKPRGDTSLP